MTKNISIAIAFLTGLGLIFLGARFLLSPETAEAGYGIHFNEQGDYSFHYIKGIRDLFTGLIICILVLTKQTKALGITLLIGTIIPIVDMLIVLSKEYNGITQAIPHISAIIVCFFCGLFLLINRKKQQANNTGFTKIIQSADTGKESVIEFNIMPNEKTPWHYHTLFSETFEVLKGTLEVGQNNQVFQLKKGDIVTIKPNEKHYYHNISNDECLIKATISPGNKNFENALLILKGLAKDGLASASGTPKKFSDLALFVYLNNSRMVGFQKIAEPIFNYVAQTAIKKGRLKELELKYCKGIDRK
jgi:quercetin dioxygenase-like cupin family protein